MEQKTYVFFGNVGAGKGTQIDLMKKFYTDNNRHVVYFYPGAEFRALISKGGYAAELINRSVAVGHLVPDEIATGFFTSRLVQDLTAESILFTDGYPRSPKQAESFIALMEFYGRENVEMVYINVSKEEAIARMKLRGRSDDTDEGIANRFEVYEKNVLPALEVLKQKGYKLHTINGLQSVDKVYEEVKQALGL